MVYTKTQVKIESVQVFTCGLSKFIVCVDLQIRILAFICNLMLILMNGLCIAKKDEDRSIYIYIYIYMCVCVCTY